MVSLCIVILSPLDNVGAWKNWSLWSAWLHGLHGSMSLPVALPLRQDMVPKAMLAMGWAIEYGSSDSMG